MHRKKWVNNAVKHPGLLRRQLHGRLGRIVIGATKRPVFTKSGEINTRTLIVFRKTQAYQKLPTKVKHRINFAITAEKFRRG